MPSPGAAAGVPLQVPIVRDGAVVHIPTLVEIRAHHRGAKAELLAPDLDLPLRRPGADRRTPPTARPRSPGPGRRADGRRGHAHPSSPAASIGARFGAAPAGDGSTQYLNVSV